MTKAPRTGHVKTRLAPPLTPDEAAALNACFVRDTAIALSDAVESGKRSGKNARGVAVYTPVGSENVYSDLLPPNFELIPQRDGSFGERLFFAAEDLFKCGFDSVCLIDSDSPTVPASSFGQAMDLLSLPGDRVVLGPTDDGGYYLIGLKDRDTSCLNVSIGVQNECSSRQSSARKKSESKQNCCRVATTLMIPHHYDSYAMSCSARIHPPIWHGRRASS
jgi:Uncharacterized protein conserved in bacteria